MGLIDFTSQLHHHHHHQPHQPLPSATSNSTACGLAAVEAWAILDKPGRKIVLQNGGVRVHLSKKHEHVTAETRPGPDSIFFFSAAIHMNLLENKLEQKCN